MGILGVGNATNICDVTEDNSTLTLGNMVPVEAIYVILPSTAVNIILIAYEVG